MQNNSYNRPNRGRYFEDRSRHQRRINNGARWTNRTSINASRRHQNSFRRTRNNPNSHRSHPYNNRDQLNQHDFQNAYNYSRQQYYPSEATMRTNDQYYYDNPRFQYHSEDVPWETSNDQYHFYNSRFSPEATWGTSQQANDQFPLVYPRNQYYPPNNQNNWWSFDNAYENTNMSVNNNRASSGNRSRSSENSSQEPPFWWEDGSEATKLLHEYFWRQNTGGEIRCIVCTRNYATVTESGESVMSSACGHLFCSGCLNYSNNYDYSSNYCWICNIQMSDLWRIFI